MLTNNKMATAFYGVFGGIVYLTLTLEHGFSLRRTIVFVCIGILIYCLTGVLGIIINKAIGDEDDNTDVTDGAIASVGKDKYITICLGIAGDLRESSSPPIITMIRTDTIVVKHDDIYVVDGEGHILLTYPGYMEAGSVDPETFALLNKYRNDDFVPVPEEDDDESGE